MRAFRRETREGAQDVRRLRDESRAAQVEVAKLGTESQKAAAQVGQSMREASGQARNARGQFARAGSEAGAAFGDNLIRDAQGRLRTADGRFAGEGRRLGASVNRGLTSSLRSFGGVAAGSRSMLLLAAGATAATAALQGIPPVLTAIGGGLAALPSLGAGATASALTLAVGLHGVGDAIEETFEAQAKLAAGTKLTTAEQERLNEALAKLSPNARKFVAEVGRLRPELVALQRLAQDRIFAGLDREFTATFTKSLPFVRRQIVRFGDDWNATFKGLVRLGRDDDFLAGLEDALGATDRLFDKVNARIPATGRMLAQLFTGSVPFIDKFGDSLLSYLDDFNAFIDRASRDGSLEEFFRDAAEQADALLDIGKEVLILVGRIGGMDQGSTVLRDMADALERFNDEAHNMRSVEGIVATGNAAVKGLIEVLLILGQTLGETLADEGTRDAVVLFFDILKVGAEIVGDLARLFSALPDPIQSTVLAGAALFLVGSKIFGIFDKLGGILGRANGHLGQMGPMGAQAAVGLERVGRAAKAAGIALAAMQIGSILIDQFADTEVKVTALSRALEEYGKTGQRTGELQRVFGKDAEETRKIYSAAADGWVQDTARFGESIPIWGDMQRSFSEAFHGQSFSGARENVAQLDAELARLITTSEDTTAAQAAFNAEFERSGLTWDEFKGLLPESSAAMQELASGVRGANLSQRLLNGTMEDAIEITGSYTDAWKALHGEMLSADEAALRAADAIDAVGESFAENGRAIDGNSRAALENRIAVQRAAEAAAAAAQQKFTETGSVQAASRAYNQHIAALREELRQAGLTKAQIDTLIKRYTTMPPLNIDSNIDTMRREAERYNETLNRIRRNVKAGGFGVNGNFVGVGGLRWGGWFEHAQVGRLREAHVAAAHPVARYAYAERATGGEAFIPKYGNPDRSVSIGRRAMEWYGMAVVPKQALAGYGQSMSLPPSIIPVPAGPQGPIVLEIRSSGSREDERLLETLRRAIRVRGGDVQVVIGTN